MIKEMAMLFGITRAVLTVIKYIPAHDDEVIAITEQFTSDVCNGTDELTGKRRARRRLGEQNCHLHSGLKLFSSQ